MQESVGTGRFKVKRVASEGLELEAATEKLICDYWPLVRRLGHALVERREISARGCQRILFAAMRKNLRRSRAVAEKDRRNQVAWSAELRRELGCRHASRSAAYAHGHPNTEICVAGQETSS
jgi:hypothetical protein